MSVAIALHVVAAIVWVGGLFFAYVALRPASAALEPPQRLTLWAGVLGRFFQWVWVAIALLLASGYWMILAVFGGFAAVGPHVHLMQATGLLMMLLFLHVYFVPFRRLTRAVAAEDWPTAGAQLDKIRKIVQVNIVLGIVTAVAGSGGRYLG